jgi:cell division initiation protein
MPERLSALDLKKKEFPRVWRGDDANEVRAFLDRAAAEVEQLTIEKRDAEDRLANASERLEHYISLEETIEKTLAAAQQTVVKMEDQARKEAELILRDARNERDRKINEARLELERLQADIARARSEFLATVARMRSTIVGFESFMQALEQEALPSAAAANDAAKR